MVGPGKYDDVCEELRERLKASGIVLIVVQGEHGNGISMRLLSHLTGIAASMPKLLRMMADEMEADLKKLKESYGNQN